MDKLDKLKAHSETELGQCCFSVVLENGELTINAKRESIITVMAFLHDDANCQFKCLVDLAGVDFPERPERFDVVYHCLSHVQNLRVRVKISTDEETPVPSIVSVYPNAGWYEREAWDMYGILFSDNPDLRRILTDYGFDGHPLRKDFPLTGYVELRYDPEKKAVVYEPPTGVSQFRLFKPVGRRKICSPWR
jgi:NADH-quinone oxidoreductase subunit C